MRVEWVLEPLVGVGPLRFGMHPDEVEVALDGAVAHVSQGLGNGIGWGHYTDWGVTGVYGEGNGLVAVAVDAMDGPLVRLRDVGLVARVPSEVCADLRELALREGVSVRLNRGGDPEIEAWGVSMGASQEHGLSPEGYTRRLDTVITSALLVCPELAADPYGAEPVVNWWDVRDEPTNTGVWPVRAEQERQQWEWSPLKSVGPLGFGMSPQEVAAALCEEPASRHGRFPLGPPWEGPAQWNLEADRFDRVGVTAHYSGGHDGRPALGAVTVHGRTGPQVDFAGIRLIGMSVTAVDTALTRYTEGADPGLVFGCAGDLGVDGLNMYVRATRAGDAMVSEARFCQAEWEDHG
ncbi:hypothetical protein [Streptomyces fructofermentans]|uniref:Uncharacterized protein n=1 Tax=Streptomyces fructofermentans TaxID=152141 RepID=A0A918U361_9ACTN|nr:hypothetical protein [Streptomyces fructofermentans]GGX85724.1 hypothetical protein GCM10010515_61360 [Streptomyces fructofermentans]